MAEQTVTTEDLLAELAHEFAQTEPLPGEVTIEMVHTALGGVFSMETVRQRLKGKAAKGELIARRCGSRVFYRRA